MVKFTKKLSKFLMNKAEWIKLQNMLNKKVSLLTTHNHLDQWLILIQKELSSSPSKSTKKIKIWISIKLLICSFKETEFNNLHHSCLTVWEKTSLKMPHIKQKLLKLILWLLHKLLKVFFKWKFGDSTTNQKLPTYANKKDYIKEHFKIILISKILKEFF